MSPNKFAVITKKELHRSLQVHSSKLTWKQRGPLDDDYPSYRGPPQVAYMLIKVKVLKYEVYTPNHIYGSSYRSHRYSVCGYFGPLGCH